MNDFLYCVFDKLSGKLSEFGLYSSDGLAAREILKTLRVPLKDSLLLKLFEYDKSAVTSDMKEVSLNDVRICDFNVTVIPWSVYKFPENQAEALSPLEASTKIQEIHERVEVNHNRSRSFFKDITSKIVKGDVK